MDKATALQHLTAAWDAINALGDDFANGDLPADMFSHLPTEEARRSALYFLGPLLMLHTDDAELLVSDDLAEQIKAQVL